MIAYLALGSNLGDSLHNLQEARRLLVDEHLQVTASSQLYETAPYGPVPQDDYLNAVLRVETDYSPEALLAHAHRIEEQLGRKRLIHWGPRTIDIDILLMEGSTVDTPDLKIPHPEIAKRSFVLIPLADVYLKEELFDQSFDQLIAATGNADEVKLSQKVW